MSKTITRFDELRDVEVGDIIHMLGGAHRVFRIERHGDEAAVGYPDEQWRIAYCDDGWSITITESPAITTPRQRRNSKQLMD